MGNPLMALVDGPRWRERPIGIGICICIGIGIEIEIEIDAMFNAKHPRPRYHRNLLLSAYTWVLSPARGCPKRSPLSHPDPESLPQRARWRFRPAYGGGYVPFSDPDFCRGIFVAIPFRHTDTPPLLALAFPYSYPFPYSLLLLVLVLVLLLVLE